jgi:hypothetical protein
MNTAVQSAPASGPLGFPGAGMARGVGIVLLLCTLLYTAPQTAVLDAILLTRPAVMGRALSARRRALQADFPSPERFRRPWAAYPPAPYFF